MYIYCIIYIYYIYIFIDFTFYIVSKYFGNIGLFHDDRYLHAGSVFLGPESAQETCFAFLEMDCEVRQVNHGSGK